MDTDAHLINSCAYMCTDKSGLNKTVPYTNHRYVT